MRNAEITKEGELETFIICYIIKVYYIVKELAQWIVVFFFRYEQLHYAKPDNIFSLSAKLVLHSIDLLKCHQMYKSILQQVEVSDWLVTGVEIERLNSFAPFDLLL